MNFECPNCHSSIEYSGEDSAATSTCPVCGSDLPHFAETVAVPRGQVGSFGRYTLVRIAGQGKFGTVWEAEDTLLGRTVALKIPRRIPKEPTDRNIFLREARAAATLQHPSIVQIFDIGEHNGVPYIAGEFVHGRTLASRLAEERLSRADTVQLVLQLAEALGYAHQSGVVHRDLKPGNILLDEQGRPKITDFGLAFISGNEDSIQAKGIVAGTPAYMSPEQARGATTPVDARTDIYALGVILYELFTGRRPFDSSSSSFFLQLQNVTPASPRQFAPDLPDSLAAVVMRALEKQPENRFATTQDFATALREASTAAPESLDDTRIAPADASSQAVFTTTQTKPSLYMPFALLAATVLLAAALMAGWPPPGGGNPKPPDNPLPPEKPTQQPIPVTIVTEPAGAQLVIWPLDPITWKPRFKDVKRPNDKSSLDIDLLPGDYLIVAVLDDGRFHEVWRHIPEHRNTASVGFPHNGGSMNRSNKRWQIPEITIPLEDTTNDMAFFEGEESFSMGVEGDIHIPSHNVYVPAFYLDRHEVTVAEFRAANGDGMPRSLRNQNQFMPKDGEPVTVFLDDAIAHAERVGKRLMTEIEFELAATNRGLTRFPWGDAPERLGSWSFTREGGPIVDQTSTNPPVVGLFSDVAEWTMTRYENYPVIRESQIRLPGLAQQSLLGSQVIRGGDEAVTNRQPPEEGSRWRELGARMRHAAQPATVRPGLGFRCARSAQPRLTREDFEHHLSD